MILKESNSNINLSTENVYVIATESIVVFLLILDFVFKFLAENYKRVNIY